MLEPFYCGLGLRGAVLRQLTLKAVVIIACWPPDAHSVMRELTLHLVFRLRCGTQIPFKTLIGETITLDVEFSDPGAEFMMMQSSVAVSLLCRRQWRHLMISASMRFFSLMSLP